MELGVLVIWLVKGVLRVVCRKMERKLPDVNEDTKTTRRKKTVTH